jgi:glycosyltransferase involved in cell wall biosynthesis/predicted  nucleic acid-binding Zn-ribbon protein
MMTIHQAERASIAALESEVHVLVECGKFGDALDAIRQFAEAVINNQRSVGKVFASADLDKLCRYVGEVAANKAGISSPNLIERKGTVILATELVNAGGHVELIKDIIRLKLFDAPISILLTDILDRAEEDIITNFSVTYGVTIEVAMGRSTYDRLMWVFDRLRGLVPTTLVLLTYNQDSVGIAAASSHVADNVIFIHHGDHHLSLGVTCKDFIHVDPHNIGFFHCKDELGIKNNYYWPLTVNCDALEPRSNSFLVDGNLVTCSSGRPEKFDASNYLYDYFKLIPKLLAATSGRHIHIGSLTTDMEAKLQHGLMTEGVDPARFINIPWVPSVARALIENNVDLYISSFPIGGGKASIEAMAAGIPLLMHQNYLSRFHGGEDLAYPDAWIWRNEADLLDIVSNITVDDLMRHSLLSRAHYDKFHSDQSLIGASDFSKIQDMDAVPKLRQYTPDDLQVFLDEAAEIDANNRTQIIECDRQINAYRLQAEKIVVQIHDARTNIAHLNQALADRVEQINAYRLQAEEFVAQIRDANTQIDHFNQALADRDEQINAYRLQAEKIVAQIRDARTQIDHLNQAIAERDEQIDGHRLQAEQSEAPLHKANTKINNLNQSLIILEHDIAALRSSTSWRITKPLRFVSHPLSGLKLVSLGKRAYRKLTVNLNKLPEGFDRDVYLKLNPDVADAGIDPAMHYLLDGCFEGRVFSLTALEFCVDNDLKPDRESSLVVRHELIPEPNGLPEDFDKDIYLKLNPDVAKAGVDPVTHYLLCGFQEGRAFSLPALELFGDHELIPEPDGLPEDFDKDMYLKLNPDVAKAGVDPVTHYLRRGFQESRLYTLPEMTIYGDYDFKPDRETILVVSHEASRTGAPMLSLNIVQAFVKSYNVVALLLGGGSLSDAFKQSGAAVIESFQLRRSPDLANDFVSQLCGSFIFKFALVNSIESRAVLPPLGDCFIPVISLIHEFATYTRPRDSFRSALFWSGEVVFSANVTMENARVEYPDLGDRSTHILPQGRCLLPLDGLSEEQHQAESTHIHRLIRPKGLAEDTVIVLGAGSVQLRKGVDLFIECAARVVNVPDGNRCRFIWIGNGYDPDNDVGYSVYLADQIRRAGLQKHVFFIDETAAIETAYEEADLLLLSSRLDPLPNVAIDAMAHGVPVLCFDKTTGIADFLIRSGLREYCVADYIDSSNMAKKILALAGSQTLRKNVAEQCRTASLAYFNMDDYVASLEILAKRVCEFTQQEKEDTKTILDSGLFRRDFSCPPYQQGQSIEDEVRLYVRAWASGISRRKPFPGFHPGIFKEQHGLATQGADPFADYLRSGQPKGPWNYPVIVAEKADVDKLPDNHRVALQLHIYYPGLLPKIITRLACNRICPDLYVSITDENVRQSVTSQLREYKGNVVDIQLVPNRGRDIGPLLTAFGPSFLVNYDFVGHIHTKKTADIKDAAMAESWYKFLLENLLGGESGPMADGILARMKNDASIGIVFPDDPYVVGWGASLTFAEPLAERMGLAKLPEHFIFPVGSMFWARTSALAPLMDLKLGWDDYPEEPLPYDGTSLHALERLFSLVVSENNLRCATTNVVGLTR